MKTKLIFVCLLYLALNCKAQNPPSIQQIIPIEDFVYYNDNEIEVSDNTYYKDVNNLLDKYVGTWVGIYDNNSYEFQINEITYESDIRPPMKFDELRMRYKITDSNGNVIESTLGLPDESLYVIKGKYLSETETYYVLLYIGFEAKCGQQGDIFIEVNNSITEMELYLVPEIEFIFTSDCPNGVVPQTIPTDKITLIKQ